MYLLMVARQSGFKYIATLTYRDRKFRPVINARMPIFTSSEAIHRAAMNGTMEGKASICGY